MNIGEIRQNTRFENLYAYSAMTLNGIAFVNSELFGNSNCVLFGVRYFSH